MLEQAINIELLKLFDLIQASPEYAQYRQLERDVLSDYDLLMLINLYNDLSKTSYQDDDKTQARLAELKQKVDADEIYCQYLNSLAVYQDMIEAVSKIIFKDIINIIKEGERCAHQQR